MIALGVISPMSRTNTCLLPASSFAMKAIREPSGEMAGPALVLSLVPSAGRIEKRAMGSGVARPAIQSPAKAIAGRKKPAK